MIDPNRPSAKEMAEIKKRTQAILERKRKTGKHSLTRTEMSAVLGDDEGGKFDYRPDDYDPADSKSIGVRNRTLSVKNRNGGIVGVSCHAGLPRPYVTTICKNRKPRIKYHRCAMDAVETRNRWAEEDYPGQPEFQCGIPEAFEKWGCSCGRHVHPEHGVSTRARRK